MVSRYGLADADGVFRGKTVDPEKVRVVRTGKGEYLDVEQLKSTGNVERLKLSTVGPWRMVPA